MTINPRYALVLTLFLLASAKKAPKLLDDGWTVQPSYPLEIFESTGAFFPPTPSRGPQLLVSGGYLINTRLQTTLRTFVFPIFNPQWKQKADMPYPLTHVAQAVVGQNLYTVGGFIGRGPGRSTGISLVYNRNTNRWRELPRLPEPRAGGGLVWVRRANALFYSSGTYRRGGGSFRSEDSGDSWVLFLGNLGAGWQKRRSLSNPRNHMAGVSVGDRHFFVGGQHRNREDTGNQRSVDEYDFDRDVWIRRQGIPMPLGHIAVSTVEYEGGFLIVGGVQNGRRLSSRILYYDVAADAWSFIGSYPRMVQSPVCAVFQRTLYCATGSGRPGNASSVFSRRLSRPMNV